jgi:molybdopterin synthase sulfur carrier subunit
MSSKTGRTNTMKVLYFAWVRERIGQPAEEIEPPASVRTVGDLLRWLRERDEAHAEALKDEDVLRVAVDQHHADLDTPIENAQEVAFFPPVTGG